MKVYQYLAAFFLGLSVISATCVAEPRHEGDSAGSAREAVVLLHGLGRNEASMWLLARRIEQAGFDVIRVGYDSLHEHPDEIVSSVTRDIDACCKALQHPVHFVGHSLGGLVIRAYLAENRLQNHGRVILIGTPNNGTPLVDEHRDTWWIKLAGPTAKALGTDPESFPSSLPAPDYPVGVIAGLREGGLNSDVILADSDGLVPVESTKVEGMEDFVIVETGHSLMRYSDEVATQTIAFLKHGRFLRMGKVPGSNP